MKQVPHSCRTKFPKKAARLWLIPIKLSHLKNRRFSRRILKMKSLCMVPSFMLKLSKKGYNYNYLPCQCTLPRGMNVNVLNDSIESTWNVLQLQIS